MEHFDTAIVFCRNEPNFLFAERTQFQYRAAATSLQPRAGQQCVDLVFLLHINRRS